MTPAHSLLLIAALTTAQPPVLPMAPALCIDPVERELLMQLDRGGLPALRAGGVALPTGLEASERVQLLELEESLSAAQRDLRAGDLEVSNDDLTTVLLIVGILVGLAILL